ncbi:MAG: PTS sugar transporter subunit IIC [Spirochaetia bacterium]|nr:PTS sugar transporter subunit IIC [Spirochaetia bacterium]
MAKNDDNFLKRYSYHIFIDGLSGMAVGLFSTLIVGTILTQVGVLFGGSIGKFISCAAAVAKGLTGAGIAVGVAYKYKVAPLVAISAAVAGMCRAFAGSILSGAAFSQGALVLKGPGEPLGAFVAAFAGIELGRLVSGKTKLDILVTPFVTIIAGSVVGFLVGPPISNMLTALGALINWGTEQQPILMGILVSVIMGMCLTLPISSAALGIILGLSGIAGGAAVVGCSAQMVGFAVMSYRENRMGGLLAQGIGTSMLQMPNIVKKPVIWLPVIIASAILGPISSKVLGMTCTPVGSGMGTSGIIGQIMTYQSMSADGVGLGIILTEILIMHVLAPAVITLAISEFMRKKGWISSEDLKLDI